MGKNSKSTIGYKYFLGLHAVLCQKMDAVLKLQWEKKTAWEGEVSSGPITIDRPALFGGKKQGGGVQGIVRVLDGNAAQTAPAYLVGNLLSSVAYRGFVSLVWEKIYIGNSPYLRPWAAQVKRTATLYDNWRSDIAAITWDGHDDCNPAHILRDILLDPENGGSDNPGEIGDTFSDAAELFVAEGFGLSLVDQSPSDADSIVREVERHVDAKVYSDRLTGQWQIKPIRNDYDVDQLTALDESVILEWVTPPERALESELINQMTLTYTKRENGEDAAMTLSNTALILTTGTVSAETIEYPGITNPDLAGKVLQRDLIGRSKPLLRGAFYASFAPPDINLGSPLIISDSRLDLDPIVVRVSEMDLPTIKDNRYLITFVEDAFDFNADLQGLINVDDPILPVTGALPMDYLYAIEMPYWFGILDQGQSTIDGELSEDPDGGVWAASGKKPDGRHIYIDLFVGGEDVGDSEFSPSVVLSASAGAYDTTLTCTYHSDLAQIEVGDMLLMGDEFVRLDAKSDDGLTATLTVGRGCLDTVPQAHTADTALFVVRPYADGDGVSYTAGEIVTLKQIPLTGGDGLALADAPEQTVDFDSRAIRPYPVGQFQVDGVYEPVGLQSGTVTLTWAHRDRTQQTTLLPEDHTESDIGPEMGVEYFLVRRWVNADGTIQYSETGATLAQVTTTTVDVDDSAFMSNANSQSDFLEVGILTQRSGYDNWQTPFVRMEVDIVLPDALDQENGDQLLTESGGIIELE